MGPFTPTNFKGRGQTDAVPVFIDKLPLTIGGLAGKDAYFGRIASVVSTSPRNFVTGIPTGNIVKGMYITDPTIMYADPAMNNVYYEGRPCTLITYGLVELSRWELDQAAPVEGSNVWANNTTGVVAFTPSTTSTLAGHTRLNAYVYEVLGPNGVKLFLNYPLVTAASTAPATTATPTANPAAGAVQFPIGVKLASTTAGSTIYYTLDGTTPTQDSQQFVNGDQGILLTAAVTLKAIAVRDGMNPSAMLTANYTQA
jgi:hypothetical protein